MTKPSAGDIVVLTELDSEPHLLVTAVDKAGDDATGVLLADLPPELLHRLRASDPDTATRRQLAQTLGLTDDLMSFTVPHTDYALVERDSSRPHPFERGHKLMARVDPLPVPATDTTPPDTTQWRLRRMVGDHAHDVAIERRAVVEG